MKEIGGYFEVEDEGNGIFPHKGAVCFNTGRNAFEFILLALPKVERVWIPYYSCEAVLEPLKRIGIDYSFYHINDSLEINGNVDLGENDYLVANNYFGIKDQYIDSLINQFGPKLIIDNTQAFYHKTEQRVKSFYSCRKFFGVPDGGVAYCEENRQPYLELKQDDSSDRMSHLYIRKRYGAEKGYSDFKKAESELCNQHIKLMSSQTREMLNNIDYESIKNIRRRNYNILHKELRQRNLLKLPEISSFECPMVYPYLSENSKLKNELIAKKIFVASYWQNVHDWISASYENILADCLIPIPCDQRCSEDDMKYIVGILRYDENS